MKIRDNSVYLRHIVDAILQIEHYLGDVAVDGFAVNKMLQDAVIRQLEIIGEASGNLSKDFCNKHPAIPWGQIVAMRNRIAHEYMNVDIEIVWEITQHDLPFLKDHVTAILERSEHGVESRNESIQ